MYPEPAGPLNEDQSFTAVAAGASRGNWAECWVSDLASDQEHHHLGITQGIQSSLDQACLQRE